MSQAQKSKQNVTVSGMIKFGEQVLKSYNQPDAEIDARLLAMYLLECDRMHLIVNGNEETADHIKESYMYLIAKRTQGIPLQYITKEQEFMGLKFYVDERVLIPRQDTETLVETIINLSKETPIHKAVEVGVGSGCISISLAHFIPELQITALDICDRAIDVAKRNIGAHHMNDRIEVLQSDVFSNLEAEEGLLDLIVSNPPYISLDECKQLMREVKECEPLKALTDGNDGLTFYRRITNEAPKYLRAGGVLAYEIGYNQGQAVCEILSQEGFREIQLIKDLAGHDRVVIGKK